MRWKLSRRSTNIEDRRGMRGGARPFPTGGMRIPGGRVGRAGGIGGIGAVILVLAMLFLGVDPSVLLTDGVQDAGQTSPSGPRSAAEQELDQFVAHVLGETEDTWDEIFARVGGDYEEPTLTLFEGRVDSHCGTAGSAVGPFYCPGDRRIYLDVSFFEELERRFQAPGDFARAYVIAHEVGHHVQTLLGVTQEVHAARAEVDEAEANALSVRMELQADCFAGVWAHHADRARQVLEAGDVEEALGAASAIGDDRLQRQSQGYVVPDAFTHGTSEQRARWFRTGLEEGSIEACNTFAAGQM